MHNVGMHYLWAHGVRILLWVLAAAVALLLVPIVMRLSVSRFVRAAEHMPDTQVAVILGASVIRGVPSPLLEKRIDAAIDLYAAGKVGKILVTGDNAALSYDEVTPVRKYLQDAGIPARDIFLDHAGFDTYSSIYRARDVFEARSLTITTQDFHLPRALWIARRLGMDAYGYVAAGGESSLSDYAREIPASWKALLDILIRREPKHLGEPLPLTGSGEKTWY